MESKQRCVLHDIQRPIQKEALVLKMQVPSPTKSDIVKGQRFMDINNLEATRCEKVTIMNFVAVILRFVNYLNK